MKVLNITKLTSFLVYLGVCCLATAIGICLYKNAYEDPIGIVKISIYLQFLDQVQFTV